MKKYMTVDEIKAIGPRIKKLLKDRNIKIDTAAEVLGFERSYYYKLLKGNRSMTIDCIIAHCCFLDVSISYLLFGDESLLWDEHNNVVPGEIEILIEKVISSIENLDEHHRAEKAAKLGHRYAVLVSKMK